MGDKDLMKLREASIEYCIAEEGESLPFMGRSWEYTLIGGASLMKEQEDWDECDEGKDLELDPDAVYIWYDGVSDPYYDAVDLIDDNLDTGLVGLSEEACEEWASMTGEEKMALLERLAEEERDDCPRD